MMLGCITGPTDPFSLFLLLLSSGTKVSEHSPMRILQEDKDGLTVCLDAVVQPWWRLGCAPADKACMEARLILSGSAGG